VCVCVCVCVRARARARVCVCVLALKGEAHCSYSKTSDCSADTAAGIVSQQPARAAKLI
jgi:hypothetical protein